MKLRKRVFSIVMAIITTMLFCALSIQAAMPDDTVSPLWNNTTAISTALIFSDDGYGYAEAIVSGHPGTEKIVIDVYVYRQSGNSWFYVAQAHNTTYSISNIISCKFTPISNTNYKAEYTFTVTLDGVDEVIYKTKYKTYTPST